MDDTNASKDLEGHAEFMETVNRTLSGFAHNLHDLFKSLPDLVTAQHAEELIACTDLTPIQDELKGLGQNLTLLVEGCEEKHTAMTDDLSCLQARIENLQDEWQAQQEHMGRMQAEMYKLRRQLSHQSSFCASLGAVLGQLVWKASQVAIVVEKMLAGNKVGDFFCIVEGTLASFLETYKGSMPGPESDERQFLLSMCGVITNIAAVPQGREFLCGSPNGLTLIQAILKAIPAVPLPSGRELKRLLIMVLYNISINKTGQAIMQSPGALIPIADCLGAAAPPDLTLNALRVLQSVTYQIPSIDILHCITCQINMDDIRDLARSEDVQTRDQATAIINNIRKANDEFQTTQPSKCAGNIPFYCTKTCN